ncbi:hypothetical protein ACI51Z_20765 [Pectobacterium carotovorum]|uniref:hypothetical protein n=1 Tax=Pectobacterium carotovorum TaxID=554 RepID=UPI00386B2AC2
MLLNKRNIDFCCSIEIGMNTRDQKLKMRADKLSVVSSFYNSEERKITHTKLKKMRKNKFKKYRVQYIRNKEGKPYRKALLIRGKNKYSPILLRIDYSPINRNTGGIRLDFRPQHMTTREIDHLLSWIDRRLGGIFYQLLARAWVTQIDVALDIYNCKLDDYIWGLERSGKSKYFNTENGLPGLRVGSNRSILHILCYEKVDANSGIKLAYHHKAEFININMGEYQQFLRIEARYKPGAKPTSKRGNPVMLADIMGIKNPFERLQIYSKDLAHELLIEGFINKIPKKTSISALKHAIVLNRKNARLSRQSIGIIVKHKIELFDRDIIWQKWSLCTEKLSSIFNIHSYLSMKKSQDKPIRPRE